ncbi:MAG: PEGA domain-containing protein [Deltaproteobacteria bacterium]|nr:PEGA domain-containing protein [Deltaproteobacteria bacterium]
MRILGVAALVLSWAGLGVAQAKQPTVAVLGIEAPIKQSAQLTEWVTRHISRLPGLRLVPGKNLDEIKLVFGCVDESPDCMAKVGRGLKARRLLWGRVEAGKLTLHVLDVKRRRIEPAVSVELERREVERATAQLLMGNRGSLRIEVALSGVEAFVDKRTFGEVTADSLVVDDLIVGSHRVELRKPDYQPYITRVEVRAGQTTTVTAVLLPVPEAPVAKADRRLWWKVSFYSSLTAAVGMGVGVLVGGLSVKDLEDQKSAELRRIVDAEAQKTGNEPRLDAEVMAALVDSSRDSCAVASQVPDSSLHNICDRGKSRARLVTGLAIGAGAALGLSAFFFYRAYIARAKSETPKAASRLQFGATLDGQQGQLWLLSRF